MKNDKEKIYNDYITYINSKKDFSEKDKELILKYLRDMLVHNNRVYLLDELDNCIHKILTTSAEKKILAKNLRAYMDLKVLNVNDLANRLNLPYSTVNDWVNGVSYPRQDKLRLLADTFNVSKSDLTELPRKRSNTIPVLGTIPARYSH